MKSLGDEYETLAGQWLQARELRLLARNFRARTGEIDLIALDGEYLVFIEVRGRSNPFFSSAAASVDRRKQQRILRTAQMFLQRHAQWSDRPCRFDVITFEPPQSGTNPELRWIKSAFTA